MDKEICRNCKIEECKMYRCKDRDGNDALEVYAGEYFTKVKVPSYMDSIQGESFEIFVKTNRMMEMNGMLDRCDYALLKEGGKRLFYVGKKNSSILFQIGRFGTAKADTTDFNWDDDEWAFFGGIVPKEKDSHGCPYHLEHLMDKLNRDEK